MDDKILTCDSSRGWDQTGSNGANLSFPDALDIPQKGPHAARNEWLIGVVNA